MHCIHYTHCIHYIHCVQFIHCIHYTLCILYTLDTYKISRLIYNMEYSRFYLLQFTRLKFHGQVTEPNIDNTPVSKLDKLST